MGPGKAETQARSSNSSYEAIVDTWTLATATKAGFSMGRFAPLLCPGRVASGAYGARGAMRSAICACGFLRDARDNRLWLANCSSNVLQQRSSTFLEPKGIPHYGRSSELRRSEHNRRRRAASGGATAPRLRCAAAGGHARSSREDAARPYVQERTLRGRTLKLLSPQAIPPRLYIY